MRCLMVLALALLPVPALAQGLLPGLYDVAGVAADDVLNVRAGPGVEHPVIGELSPFATGVEITGESEDFRWLRVSMGERSGWAAARFLRHTGPDWSAGLPVPMACSGTEPFWGFVIAAGSATWSGLDMDTVNYVPVWSGTPFGYQPFAFSALFDAADPAGVHRAVAMIEREECSDGMSDRDFGLSVLLTRIGPDGPTLYAGCCALAP